MDVKEIKNRFERGYTMAIYGTRENIHEQMNKDIEKLLKAINYTHSCEKLNERKVLSFKDWCITFGYIKGNNYFEKRGIGYSK